MNNQTQITSNQQFQQHKSSFTKILSLKQQLLDIRTRKSLIPDVPNPKIIDLFQNLYQIKSLHLKKQQLEKIIQIRKKQYKKIKKQLQIYKQKYNLKTQSFKQRPHLIKILSSKLQNQYQKIKQKFKDVQFNKIIIHGIQKVQYYRLTQILFNNNARNIFIVDTLKGQRNDKDNKDNKINRNDQQYGICLGYLALLTNIVGNIAGARIWMNFTFKGGRSTIKLNDGTIAMLNPKERRFTQALNLLSQQLYQIMKYNLGISLQSIRRTNFYQLSQELSKFLMG